MSRVALTISFVMYLIAFFGAIWLSTTGIPGGWIVAFAVLFGLLGTYLLIALKVAYQWEKAVVLRLGKFRGLRGPECSGSYPSSTPPPSGSITA